MKLYTDVAVSGTKLLVRGYDEQGRRIARKVHYEPTLYVNSEKETGYRSLANKPVEPIVFDTMYKARNFVDKHGGIIPVYGMTNFQYTYVNEEFPEDIDFDFEDVNVGIIDIEVGSEFGFPVPELAAQEITAICVYRKGIYHVFGCRDYVEHRNDIHYYKCKDERALLRLFLRSWQLWDLDIVTGWYSDYFDIPYLVNRITNVLGPAQAARLSPWGQIREKKKKIKKHGTEEEKIVYQLVGMASIDYMDLYIKHAYIPQEKYNLDTVAYVDLGENKIDYSEYRSLHRLYKQNFQKFVEYNIRDCELIKRLDDLHGLMNVVIYLAFDSKVMFEDAMGSIRLWDVIIHNDLLAQNIVVDPPGQEHKTDQFKGAFVLPPQVAMHKCVVSFDVKSLYPSLIVQNNISPETYRGRLLNAPIDIEACLNRLPAREDIVEHLHSRNYALTANGCMWDKDIEGVFPRIVKRVMTDRAKYKNLMIVAERAFEETKEKRYESEARRWKVLQHVRKIQLNSLYGCLGNEYFRWFRLDAAEGITYTGQFTIKWAYKRINEELNKLAGTEGVDFIIAMDTDSAYVVLDRLVPNDLYTEERVEYLIKFTEEVMPSILETIFNEACEMLNGNPGYVTMKREKISDKGFWTAKKRYALNVWWKEGVRYKEPKVDITGLEAIKSSYPALSRKKIKETITILLQGTEQDFQQYVNDFRKDFRKLSFDEIAIPIGCNGIYKYSDPNTIYGKGTPMHTRAAILFNHTIKERKLDDKYEIIKDGEKVKWAHLVMPNPIYTDVIACPYEVPEEFNLKDYLDYDKMFNKTYEEPISKMARACGWRTNAGGTIEDAFNAPL